MALQPLPQQLVDFLSDDERVERVPADAAFATSVAEDIAEEECEDVLHAASQERWRKANTYSYDGARKAMEALLLAHGWRVRNVPGSHAAVVEVVALWMVDEDDRAGERIAKSFETSKTARHDDEYPSKHARDRHAKELKPIAQDNVRLINAVRERLGLPIRKELVPTDENLKSRRSAPAP